MNFNSLIRAASFSPDLPNFPSAWLGHLPFAAWLIRHLAPDIFVELGTHYGHSYFSFCQSVAEAGLQTKCYAVDTWQGDEHAGQYGDEVFTVVNTFHQRYEGFSKLLRTTFDNAADSFPNESIGLLHIDGLHTYEAVRHDFETWLPKLAPGAVVLFHDTNVRECDFGVWKFWEELQAVYSNTLEFRHSFGLGVLQLNNALEKSRLEWLRPGAAEKETLRDYFSSLGEKQWEHVELNQLRQHAADLGKVIENQEARIRSLERLEDEQKNKLEELKVQVAEQDALISGLNESVQKQEHEINALRNSTSWRITLPMRVAGTQIKHTRLAVQLIRPAFRHGGGVKGTLRKAFRLYQREGLEGIKRGFRAVAAARVPIEAKNIDPAYRVVASQSAEKLFAPRVLIIAEMSIPQCKKYRVEQKCEMFQSIGIECTAFSWTETEACLNALQTHSLVIFYRVPAFSQVLVVIDEAKRLRLPTLWEVDDFIFDREVLAGSRTLANLDKSSFEQLIEGADLYRTAMLRCDMGIASTTALADVMKEAGLPEVYVVENALDRQTLAVAERVRDKQVASDERIVRIVYGSGTNTHNVDFEEAAPSILKVLKRFPNVRFRVIGKLDLPDALAACGDQLELLPSCPYEEYLEKLVECDISIAPLENYIFNESKSNIKYLEASILKIPSVCSPRAAYSEIIVHGENGFLCETDEEWEEALTSLVIDPVLRQKVADAAYTSVTQHYSPESIAKRQVAPLTKQHKRKVDTLRVLSVNCYYYPRSFGGATIVAEELNRRIHGREGIEVFVFTTLPPSVAPAYSIRRYENDGMNIFGIGLPSSLDERLQFENSQIDQSFADVLALVQPDVVHFHSIQGIGVSVLDMCMARNVKYIVTLHDAWWLCGRHFMLDRQGSFCGQKKLDPNVCAKCVENANVNSYRQERLRHVLNNASMLLAPSRYFADFYAENGFTKVKVNKNGVIRPREATRFRRKQSLRFGYIGGNTEIKGFHLVKKTFSELEGCNLTLVLVDNTLNLGFSSYKEQDLIGISKVEIQPAFTHDSIDHFFANIDVLLFPSQCKESFGLAVREALVRNVWVIATDAGGVVEDIRPDRNGYIVPFNDTGAGLKQAVLDTVRYFDGIAPGEKISLENKDITFFEDQADELVTVLRDVKQSATQSAHPSAGKLMLPTHAGVDKFPTIA